MNAQVVTRRHRCGLVAALVSVTAAVVVWFGADPLTAAAVASGVVGALR